MSLVIPPGYGLAAYEFTSATGTAPFVTTIGVDLSDAGGDFVAAANAAFSAYAGQIMPITDNDLTLSRVVLSIGQDGPGGSVDSTRTPVQGGSTGTFAPVAMAPVVRKVTAQIGRSGRGRMFLPGLIQEAGVDPTGGLTNTFRNQLQGKVDDFLEVLQVPGIDEPSLPPVLLHSAGLDIAPTPIQSLLVTPLVGWIRGRIR